MGLLSDLAKAVLGSPTEAITGNKKQQKQIEQAVKNAKDKAKEKTDSEKDKPNK
jgi:hypothetical protein